MVYTSYLYKLKRHMLPEYMDKVIIMRFPPSWLRLEDTDIAGVYNVLDFPNTCVDTRLAPDEVTLFKYKSTRNWQVFELAYINRLSLDDVQAILYAEKDSQLKGNDTIYICCEADYMHCHRSILGCWFKANDVEWQEY